jgi:hypothetical protein
MYRPAASCKRLTNPSPEDRVAQNLDIGTKSQNIAQKLSLIRIGNLKHIAAINRFVRPLIRMPLLARNPTRPFRREFEFGPGL